MQIIPNFDVPYDFLSNFYPCEIYYEGIKYPSVEHAFQAAKTLDIKQRKQIASTTFPGTAKRMGRSVTLRSDWENIKVSVMKELLTQKFSDKNPVLQDKLESTGYAELVEGNTWKDTFWGVYNGVGKNTLGKLLMEVRSQNRINKYMNNEEGE